MYAVIEESSTAPTEAMWRRLRAMSGVPQPGAAGAAYLARAGQGFEKLKASIEARQKRANIHETVRAWIGHISQLAAKIANGWRPLLNELTPAEWQGLDLWRSAGQRFADSHVKCPGCGRAIPRGQSADACGWKEKGK